MNYRDVFLLKNKQAIVTGGAGLVGAELCRALSEAGACVYMADNDADKANAILRAKRFNNKRIKYLPFDITSAESMDEAFCKVIKKSKKIDAFINCAYPRTSDWGNCLEDVTSESFRKNVDMHLNGYFLSSQKALSFMRKQRSAGVVINFGSIYGVMAPRFDIYKGTKMTMPVAYSAIKAGVVGFSKYLAAYYGKYNIRVNVVCPGGLFNDQDPRFVKAYAKFTPMGRMASPSDIVGPVIFLCSDAARYITGQVLMVDGGWSIW